MNILELYDIAEKSGIEVDHMKLKTMKAFSVPGNIVIDMSQLSTLAETKVCFGHELGHEMKAAFYELKNTLETRSRQEERANRWAIHTLVPFDDLMQAVDNGITLIWELAEHFDVTEEFINTALRIYACEGYIER